MRDIVPIGFSQNHLYRNALCIDEEVVLAPALWRPLGSVQVFLTWIARTVELFAIIREKLSWSAPHSSASSSGCNRVHTPIFRNTTRCRLGRRSSSRLRRGCSSRLRLTGNSGCTILHNPSSTSSVAVSPPDDHHHANKNYSASLSFCFILL